MVQIVHLNRKKPPASERRYLLFEWATSGSFAIFEEERGLRYRVGPSKHRFWSIEAPHLARRMKLGKVFYLGEPDSAAVAAPPSDVPVAPGSSPQIHRRSRKHTMQSRRPAQSAGRSF